MRGDAADGEESAKSSYVIRHQHLVVDILRAEVEGPHCQYSESYSSTFHVHLLRRDLIAKMRIELNFARLSRNRHNDTAKMW
jgi:hypothetical protein